MIGELLRAQCTEGWGCEVVSFDHSRDTGISSVRALQPDLVLLSHAPGSADALPLLPSLQAQSPSAKRIVIAARLSDYVAYRLSKLNVDGVLEESVGGLGNLVAALERVRAGARYHCAEYAGIVARLRATPDAFPKLLTERQEEVLVCIAHAMDDGEIAERLGMSAATAQRHRADLLRKLGFRSTPKLMRYAIQAGFGDVSLPRDETI